MKTTKVKVDYVCMTSLINGLKWKILTCKDKKVILAWVDKMKEILEKGLADERNNITVD